MKVQNSITIFAGDTRTGVQADKVGEDRNTGEKNKTFYAGNLLAEFPLKDRIAQKKAQVQERALKIVGDAWDGDKKIDEQLQRSRDRLKELRETYKDTQDNIRALNEQSAWLMEYYEVDPDSQEQQDLELLEKAYAADAHPWSGIQLTKEEKERLAEIEDVERTAYQERQLELNAAAWTYKKTAYRTQLDIETENAVIRGIRLERLKQDPMLKAQAEAEDVMKAARDEIISMAVEEGKEHLDEEQEKKEEEAEAIKEKKEEQEEILEKRKEREDELEELMEDMPLDEIADLKNAQTEIQQEIQNIVNKMGLVEEDIKGTKVDTSV